MKSLLILTPRFPYPVVGGDRLRIYQLCRALAGQYRLTLLSLCETPEEMTMAVPADGVFHRVERVYLPKWRSWLNTALALPGRTPLQVAYYRHAGFRRRALELMAEHDGALAHLIRVGDVIKDAPGPKFLEMTDAISLNYERIRSTRVSKDDLRAKVYALEVDRLRAYEEAIVERFDHSFLVSDIDRRHLFATHPGKLSRVSVFSNGVALDTMPYQFDASGRDIIFIGNMFSLQNFDAAMYMAAEVLPLVRNARPDVRLRLIGRIQPDQAAQLNALDGVDVTGEVPDVVAAARGGAVGVCPLRLGAGVQNKVLEYMALGLPTVSTTMGLEGFHAEHGRDLLVADSTEDLATAVVRLLDDRTSAEAMARAARHYVESTHSWSAMLAPMIQLIDARLAGNASTQAAG
ncbi:glycosyltransferase involved in cell wall biosynthesis [Mitsuaria sp. BK045]|uniref:glycosyltransferase family 4 protein n=1 Tax=unclassified Roseateles TaxID=2626991 RepID=UPI0016224409|nr:MULTISPECIES: glycosyltransferase family 4 protein [unclassified Roseateles]MBB3294940.1 glycosyltransferase involved in cell wall biosynthesis [Mitsuaria sp. BK041]MBB3364156.1 glycosyltransferase involved in cell wall biosynthesis [Mitsuaria sp. BK045]